MRLQPTRGRASRIKAENELLMKYGLKNKRELWRAQSFVRTLRAQSRDLQARLRTGDPQAKIETDQLLKRCARMALLPMEGATLNDVLALDTEAVLHEAAPDDGLQEGARVHPEAGQAVHRPRPRGHRRTEGHDPRIHGQEGRGGAHPVPCDIPDHPTSSTRCRPKPEELAKQKAEEEAKVEAKEKEEIHVAKPKLKKMVTDELKEEKEGEGA